jgi:hypothetical protein
MTHPLGYSLRMNLAYRSPRLPRRTQKMSVPLGLSWSHSGVTWRVTPWPEVQFERLYGDEWIAATPTDDVFASAAQSCGPTEWRPYLDFLPASVRDFVVRFAFGRMEALMVAARCPALLETLAEAPALAAFVAAHVALRGTELPRWDEINAVYGRAGIFGVLEWLGLPASRQTLSILSNLAEPDVPKRLLEPLRTMLWEPRAIFALQRMPSISDRQLAGFCNALAA